MINTPYNPDWIHRQVTGMTAEEETKAIFERIEHNKELPVGAIVFYIKQHGMKKKIMWGKIADRYPHQIVLELFDVFESRLINGIPYNEFVPDERYQKLPKGWSYDTKLYDQSYKEIPAEMWETFRKFSGFASYNPQDIQKVIDVGYFVPVSTIDYSHIEVDYQNHVGFRLVKKMYRDEYHPTNITLNYQDVYDNYNDAEKVVEQHEEEMRIESEMSDFEWSIYQIDHELNRAFNMTENQRMKCREMILSMDNVEDIEVRVFSGCIQWKYWKNKRWNNINPDAIS